MRFVALLTLLLATSAVADDFEFWPGTRYRTEVPTYDSVLAYAPGERITSHANALRYLEALQAAEPGRIKLFRYAESWEGRSLIYAVVGSEQNIARLDDLQAAMAALADPRVTSAAQAESLVATTPGITWLSYGVHGNEISSTDAALLTAYHLLAADRDPVVDAILGESVVVLDPMQNPDGRDRFIHGFEMAEGLELQPDRNAAEHDERWPSGRVNHYTFDLNRDWLPLTQPETRGRVAALLKWFPLVFVDAHEMSGDSTYYFAPEALPYNPFIHATQRENLLLVGKNNARWFDRYGIDYFTREVFDAFYPGYGASWPLYHGTIATTYEQASVGGLAFHQSSGKLLTYRDSVRNHFVTSISTAQMVADNRQKLLRDFHEYRRSAIDEGRKGDIREYLISGRPDASAADKLAGLMVEHGVEVRRATSAFDACGKRYDAGSYAISLAQPAMRMIRTVLDPQVDMEAGFLKEQERRRRKDLPDEIYDVTGWSLPLMFNLELDACNRAVTGPFESVGSERVRAGRVVGSGAEVAYLVPWGTRASVRLLAAALRAGLEVRSSDKAFTHGGRNYPAGTLILKTGSNPDDLAEQLRHLTAVSGAEAVGVSDSWVDIGPNFGSQNVVHMPAPRIALIWDEPAGTYAAGNTRFVLERQFGYPVTAIRGRSLNRAVLSNYDVLILPESGFWAGYDEVLGAAGGERIKAWVRAGGTLIVVGNALKYAADPEVDLIALRLEDAYQDKVAAEVETDDSRGSVPGSRIGDEAEFDQAIAPLQEWPDRVAGVLVHARVDGEHWLGAGVPERINVLVRGGNIYTPLRLDQGSNVARFDSPDKLLASGYLWDENRRQLAFKPFTVVQRKGNGLVIGFTQDPNYRAYLDGLNLIFMNAVFRGPAHVRVVR